MTPLNVTGEIFCKTLGLPYHNNIVKSLRELGLVNFFRVGKKYLYRTEDIGKINDMLRRKEIEIKTDKGYYITKN